MYTKGLVLKSVAALATTLLSVTAMGSPDAVRLSGHVPQRALIQSVDLGSVSQTHQMSLAVPLKPRHLAELQTLIQRLHTPGDALYGKFLTADEFTARFAPTQQQYDQVVSSLRAKGFSDIRTNPSRLMVSVHAAAPDVEKAFSVQIHHYRATDGRKVFASAVEPTVDASISDLIYGVVGLNSFAKAKHYLSHARAQSGSNPPGNGPDGGGLSAANIKTVYDLNGISQTGTGQTLALAEFDGYTASDITAYTKQNKLATLNLQNIYIDGMDGTPSSGEDSGAGEVTLDIQLMGALAPAAKILVYEAPAPTTDQSFESEEVDVYSRIASDNLAKAVSSSWGSAEDSIQQATMQSENTSFMQMAAQGQSMFAAAGDSGAYDDGSQLSVDDPGSQPYVTSAGGTHLNVSSSLAYQSESSWNTSTVSSSNGPEGGGGGISTVWTIPSYQQGLGNSSNQGSTTMRMVPDVALDADPASGYSTYFEGQWGVVGGTSCVGPLLAAFTGLVNEARAANGQAALGNFNTALYKLAASSAYSADFHDVDDNSTNLYYPAVTGYDLSTGWGSIVGQPAFNSLVSQ